MFPLQDQRVIQSNHRHQVHAQRGEVMFKDGTAITLHPVSLDGVLQTFQRALQIEGFQWVVFDVRHFGPEVEPDILRLQPRDSHGVIVFTLRAQYATAARFLAQARHSALASWWASTAPAMSPTLAVA